MNPQAKSILTSVLMGLATSVATWAATVGIIPSSQESTIANALVAGLLYLIAGVLVWYKQRSHNQTNLIAAVNNADNGLKVVVNDAASAQIPPVAAPVKGPEAIVPALTTTASALLVGALFVGALALGVPSTARAAENARPVATGPVIDPIGLNGKATSASPLTADLSKAVSDVFKTIVDYFSTGLDEAESLSIAVPSIQDGNGHDCAVAGKSLMAELKVHPEVISGHAATDIESLRVTVSALHQICASNACRQVFTEADNAIATLGIGVSIPAFAALCAKLPSVELVKPALSDPTPAASPTPTATGN
jgi:hypothetical protein